MSRQYLRKFVPAIAALLLVPFAVFAQDESAAVGLTTSMSAEFGEYVATSENLAVYAYVEDTDGVSTCLDACTNNWHPVIVDAGVDVAVDGNVNAELVGTTERPDGSLQVTYAGQPLYTSRHDKPGDTRGQQVGRESFNLVSVAGLAITEPVEQEEVVLADDVLAQMLVDGENVYRVQCVACHGAEAQGGVGPALADSLFVGNNGPVILQILNGFPDHGMPPFRGLLDDYQIASLLTYVRSSFGNEYGPITEEEVAELR